MGEVVNFMAGKALCTDLLEAALDLVGTNTADLQAAFRERDVAQANVALPFLWMLSSAPWHGGLLAQRSPAC
jgi:hypothetical protein